MCRAGRVHGSGVRASRRRRRSRVGPVEQRMLDADELPAFRVELTERQAATARLIRAETRLREMRRTVEIARHNMRHQGLPDEIGLAEWFTLRLDDPLAHAEGTRERAASAQDRTPGAALGAPRGAGGRRSRLAVDGAGLHPSPRLPRAGAGAGPGQAVRRPRPGCDGVRADRRRPIVKKQIRLGLCRQGGPRSPAHRSRMSAGPTTRPGRRS
ncbi:CATRA conflict system CASPASE/TPR repeat-associated protein [Streptomyces sp. NPDC002156]